MAREYDRYAGHEFLQIQVVDGCPDRWECTYCGATIFLDEYDQWPTKVQVSIAWLHNHFTREQLQRFIKDYGWESDFVRKRIRGIEPLRNGSGRP